MDEKIIRVIDLVNADGSNALFGTDPAKYVVPVYQRAFAWGSDNSGKKQNEIVQLIDDVLAAQGTYYLGSLVVSKCSKSVYGGLYDYEVIDGQQRLTALYIIFACLGLKVNDGSLGYACRDESQALLRNLAAGKVSECLASGNCAGGEKELSGIRRGVRTVLEELRAKCGDGGVEAYKQMLREAFKRVKLFRIEVPEGTDLNRYFEVMNTRGEQLEQQDTVKADLLSQLASNQQAVFAEVWDACSDMDGYLQMHFAGEHEKNEPSRRECVFGKEWDCCPNIDCAEELPENNDGGEGLSFEDLVDTDVAEERLDDGETYKNARFEGIIDYPHFLLHVLKVFNVVEEIGASLQVQTDIMNLRQEFKKVFSNGDTARVMKFAQCLMKCRFYFDKYIIKREFTSVKDEGAWSLKELAKSGGKKESAYYRDTQENGDKYVKHEKLLMIEACLRVSYTNPKVMHWITNLLHWLYVKGAAPMDEFLAYAQGIARSAVRQFLAEGDYNKGVQTPNIVLNYLDYLLWMDRKELVLKPEFHSLFETSFAFEFRNSVEHWYPQHPDADGCPEWRSVDEAHGVVDRFGNLALLQSNINAHFSNLPPRGKCGYGATKNGSVKLRIMAALTGLAANSAQVDENETWRSSICEKHEEDMLKILKADCESHPDDVEMLQ